MPATTTPTSEKISVSITLAGERPGLPYRQEATPRQIYPPGVVPRLGTPEELPIPRTFHEVRGIVRRLADRPKIAAATAACDIVGPVWKAWTSDSTATKLDFPDLPERVATMLRGWLLDVTDPTVTKEMQRRLGEAIRYVSDRLTETPGQLTSAWMSVISALSAVMQDFDLDEHTMAVDCGLAVQYLVDVYRHMPGEGTQTRFAERWWSRFGALWPLARPLWQ